MKKIGIIGVILLLFLTACSNKKAENQKKLIRYHQQLHSKAHQWMNLKKATMLL